MTLWRFAVALDGWRKANGHEAAETAPPTDDEFEAMKAAHAEIDARRTG
jgi:hypothetical protein